MLNQFRPSRTSVVACLFVLLLGWGCGSTQPAQPTDAERRRLPPPLTFVVVEPTSVPVGASVPRLRIEALDNNRELYTAWSGDIRVAGLRVRSSSETTADGWEAVDVDARVEMGRLTITAEQFDGTDFTIGEGGLQVSMVLGDDRVIVATPAVSPLFAWLRLLPPVTAIVLAVVIRDVNVALLLATFSGCLLYFGGTELPAAFNMLCDTLARQVADSDHASVILFTVFLGAMIGLMNDSGGTRRVVNSLARYAGTRQRGQFLTWVMGLVVFFDDYANTLLIGSSMRPLSDRLKISREKLAFLIDSTAAPIAGIALVSTWVGFEIDQMEAGLLAGSVPVDGPVARAAARLFYESIPYRFYPIIALGMVALIAVTGRDFGPMRRAESRAAGRSDGDEDAEYEERGSVWFAILPVVALVGLVVTCFVNDVDSYRLLLISSLLASVVAFLLPVLSSAMTFEACSASWTRGVGSMIPAVIVLILAWSVSDVCRPDRLDTAGLIISWVGDSVNVSLLPAIAFLVAGAIAFSIGSSFTTMALLTPLFIPLCWSLLAASGTAALDDPVFLGAVGAILAGAIFGDHCSPISDTTVLSSAAAGCSHLSHVATQMPYSLTAAGCSLLFCYLPLGFGIPWWIGLPTGLAAAAAVLLMLGRHPDPGEAAETSRTP